MENGESFGQRTVRAALAKARAICGNRLSHVAGGNIAAGGWFKYRDDGRAYPCAEDDPDRIAYALNAVASGESLGGVGFDASRRDETAP